MMIVSVEKEKSPVKQVTVTLRRVDVLELINHSPVALDTLRDLLRALIVKEEG